MVLGIVECFPPATQIGPKSPRLVHGFSDADMLIDFLRVTYLDLSNKQNISNHA